MFYFNLLFKVNFRIIVKSILVFYFFTLKHTLKLKNVKCTQNCVKTNFHCIHLQQTGKEVCLASWSHWAHLSFVFIYILCTLFSFVSLSSITTPSDNEDRPCLIVYRAALKQQKIYVANLSRVDIQPLDRFSIICTSFCWYKYIFMNAHDFQPLILVCKWTK